jgi:hypothetical protein
VRVTLQKKDYHHIVRGYRAETLNPEVIEAYLKAHLLPEVTPVGGARKKKPKPAAAGGAVIPIVDGDDIIMPGRPAIALDVSDDEDEDIGAVVASLEQDLKLAEEEFNAVAEAEKKA